ncbi:hypothetical protein [Gluconobacter kanchanaburiensis]|uniref:hypothetical protein n=1 Tax=Gluconobacter kanchanaburiensis TaxID=563199 RepID=UPI0011BDF7E5|nr:hypothetical protein [Gluconobacter kanchanaburiensis]MBF0861350.1 hypothetical protein [Gluconobacter kanchanaburiensis]
MVVICAHGDETGLVFGEFSPEVDTRQLLAGSFPARHLRLPPDCMKSRLVLITACAAGTASFATSFLSAGADAFLAPADYPDGEDVVLFIHALLHQRLSQKKFID